MLENLALDYCTASAKVLGLECQVVKGGELAESALADRLRELREEALLTVRELSELSGVSEDTITKIENGHRIARSKTIKKLARGLGVEPRELRGTPAAPKALTPP